ncbi:MAG: lipid 4kinase [Pseudomonadota bacterium]
MCKLLPGWIETIWYPSHMKPRSWWQTICFYLLLPFSLLYAMLSLLIQYTVLFARYYGLGYRSSVPVVVVGNFTVGGTGKTPIVSYLCEQLKKQGFHPGIISRGYGRSTKGVLTVTEELPAHMVGDEVALLFQLTACPIVVANRRNQAIQSLLTQVPAVDVIISDDGLQHAGLYPDLRIVVVDGQRGLGNGYCIPAGPLRAPRIAGGVFSQADVLVLNTSALTQSQVSQAITSHSMSMVPVYPMRFDVVGFCKVIPGIPYQTTLSTVSVESFMQSIQTTSVHAVAGIGNPGTFFHSLEKMGLNIVRHVYPDHHTFKSEDLMFEPQGTIIMTEKDAIKCAQHLPSGDCWVLKIRVTMDEGFSAMVGQSVKRNQLCRRSKHDR